MAKKGGKGVYIAALVLFLGGLGYLIYSGVSQDSVYFLNVSEAIAMEESELGQARLFGKVSPQNIQTKEGGLGVSFDLRDQEKKTTKTIRVDYSGAVPDTFKEGVEVIVEGNFVNGHEQFRATSLITKCPSKYEKENREG
ncbi:cytochrome c maturation protein CcmE [Maridesulfovibrio hydrothermalis]|uniref:Cytochrome c-type biogenesis protein CcmE n=1 Tax=Maridesulfovibrio hydrothermalis AM13 = DSM 14728 TaxID=1121451 RepID=L0R793_9BACT|nr:cytochrome c maturation protein CcmE [Maridesulfovibrio hydrothermalis]CCO22082.1 Cytochrome c-type biogenesis protein CcmE [Maridesulfovibrio hydrothermalis AM13 = DSM 14728]